MLLRSGMTNERTKADETPLRTPMPDRESALGVLNRSESYKRGFRRGDGSSLNRRDEGRVAERNVGVEIGLHWGGL